MFEELNVLASLPKSQKLSYLSQMSEELSPYFQSLLDPTQIYLSASRTFRSGGSELVNFDDFLVSAFDASISLNERSKKMHILMARCCLDQYKWLVALIDKKNITGIPDAKLREAFPAYKKYSFSFAAEAEKNKDFTGYYASPIKKGIKVFCVINNHMHFFFDSYGKSLDSLDNLKLFLSKIGIDKIVLIGQVTSDVLNPGDLYKAVLVKSKERSSSLVFVIEDVVSLDEWSSVKKEKTFSSALINSFFSTYVSVRAGLSTKTMCPVTVVPRMLVSDKEHLDRLVAWSGQEEYNYLLLRNQSAKFCLGLNSDWEKISTLSSVYDPNSLTDTEKEEEE